MAEGGSYDVRFSVLDWAVVLLYLTFGLTLGLFYSRTNTNTSAFFLGKRTMQGWALGLSLVATSISSNTFLAMPALSYADDFHLLSKDFPIAPVLLFAGVYLVPLWRGEPTPCCNTMGGEPMHRQWNSPFEILEARFGSTTRTYVAIFFICNQILRGGSVLYLVSLPLALAMGISTELAIVATGSLVAVYSSLGGLRAVVFTDVLQGGIMLFAGAAALLHVTYALPQGVGSVLAAGEAADKFVLGSWSWDLRERSVPAMLIYGTIALLQTYTSAPFTFQRLVAARSSSDARRAMWICAVISVPLSSFFYFIGVGLYAFYQQYPSQVVDDPSFIADRVFPFFVMTQLPSGIRGVVMAGALAAAMSTLDSNVNAISYCIVTDLARTICWRGKTEDQ